MVAVVIAIASSFAETLWIAAAGGHRKKYPFATRP
jgi:hypothetical protein